MVFLIGLIIGLFFIVCAVMNFDWLMEHRKARFFIKAFGRTGTRIFYAVLGIAIIVIFWIKF